MLIIIQPVDHFKAPPLLSSKGNYNGTSHANIYKKQATLRKAAAGSAKISGFFISILKPGRQPIEVLKIKAVHLRTLLQALVTRMGLIFPAFHWSCILLYPAPQSLTWLSCCQIIIYLTITQTWSHQQSPFSI
jgi:hypothetical protein